MNIAVRNAINVSTGSKPMQSTVIEPSPAPNAAVIISIHLVDVLGETIEGCEEIVIISKTEYFQ